MKRIGALLALLASAGLAASAPVIYPEVRPGVAFSFPHDHGAHPGFRTEWWYVTGWLRTAGGDDLGFQVTFFRTRPPVDPANPSRFAAGQVMFAHAALSDAKTRRLSHGERAARQGFGLAGARVGDADVAIQDWRLRRLPDGSWGTSVATRDFALDLRFAPTQPPMPQGQDGYSRKGPSAGAASRYYSVPHLRVAGMVRRRAVTVAVSGEAWLDREWSSNYLQRDAQGWDWTGLNLDDGSALMAFRIRRRGGGILWAGGIAPPPRRDQGRARPPRRRVPSAGDLAQPRHRRGISRVAGAQRPSARRCPSLPASAALRGAGARRSPRRVAGLLGGGRPHRGWTRLPRAYRLRPSADDVAVWWWRIRIGWGGPRLPR